MRKRRDPVIKEAVKAVGSYRKLAKALGISTQAVSKWTYVPVDRVLEMERITMIHRSKLRPDIYG